MKNNPAIRHHLRVDTDAGRVWEKEGRRGCPPGTELGFLKDTGQVMLTFYGSKYFRSHIVVFVVHGKWPRSVTHKNGVRHDDSIENLRIHW